MQITRVMAKRLQRRALAAPLTTPGDPIRAALPRQPDGLALLVSANY